MKQRHVLQLFGVVTFLGLVAVALWPKTEGEVATSLAQADVAMPAAVAEPMVESTPAAAEQATVLTPAAKTFVVYFDFDSDTLTPEAQATLAEALRYAEGIEGARLEIAGHTDRAGSQSYNEHLAARRSAAVAGEMSVIGPAAVKVAHFGEMRPAITTEDGVKEARNRRVEITISV